MTKSQVSNTSLSDIREPELFEFLFDFCDRNGYAIAAWQLPGESTKNILLSQRPYSVGRDTTLENKEAGFIFSPFDPEKDGLYIPADIKFKISNNELLPPQSSLENSSHEWLRLNFSSENTHTPADKSQKAVSKETVDTHFLETVREGMTRIEAGLIEKFVPSRRKIVELPEGFSRASAYLKLCSVYSRACVTYISSQRSGTWIGATPEELVRVENNTTFRTVALAGTQPYHEGLDLRNVAWTQKEIEEQALVERYIISCFKKIRLREYDEFGPKTVIAGNLMHLRSDFTVNMKETGFPDLGSTMLRLLHPTSAVCGMPLEPALQFLREREGYDREFYAGYLGPVNIDSNIDIFVNLRCMQLVDNKAILYAGAGVTIDSVPENEWEETEMKMNTLLRVIQS